MSLKRSHGAFEADLVAQSTPFVLFGTPLPPLDDEVRDDGSYVPLWKQEVRDERGRRRLHGAFTGGWSAGYFNTVGSKEGWTPSTFASSRTNRHKDDPKTSQQRPEDFMDAEDLADAGEARKIHTREAFSGIGSTDNDADSSNALRGLLRLDGGTMGTKLLGKMGWREGQGVGPKIRRGARLETSKGADTDSQTHLFAPENVSMISFVRKADRRGLGCQGEAHLSILLPTTNGSRSDETGRRTMSTFSPHFEPSSMKKPSANRGGIGIGVLNDTGSDDEDPFELGPRISYNKVIGGAKKKKKSTNPVSKNKSCLVSTKSETVGSGELRRCRDGRLPLHGFVLSHKADALLSDVTSEGKYPPLQVPSEWKSSKSSGGESTGKSYVSTADAVKPLTLDPKARAALLGEQQLPGKSVFDFLTPEARDRLAAASGRTDLPPARGERLPLSSAISEEQRIQQAVSQMPNLDKETATAALVRSASGGAPYAEDEEKRSRYRAYLEYQAGFNKTLPPKPCGWKQDGWIREIDEFYNCARLFKPMSGLMASRFTTSSTSTLLSKGSRGDTDEKEAVTKAESKPEDPAEEAARLGMFGHLTRSVSDFYPTRLLCKRFHVKPPADVQPDQGTEKSAVKQETSTESRNSGNMTSTSARAVECLKLGEVLDTNVNEALEGNRAGEEVFRAIFGDSDEE